jgi:NAD(P)-dependent dehydrogenase (short-subunit alcohol dehydrogenase family)
VSLPSGTRRSGSTTSHFLLPLLIDRPGGLLVEVTDGTTEYNATNYRISVFYDLAKVAVNRLGYSQGHELAPHGATAVAITPGWLRSEMMLDHFGVTEANWRDALATAPPGFAQSESPRFVGRAVAAMAADSDRARWNQQSVTAGDLSAHYGFTDVDGTQPDAWRDHE